MSVRSFVNKIWVNKSKFLRIFCALLIISLSIFAFLNYVDRNYWKKSYTQLIKTVETCPKYLSDACDKNNATKFKEISSWNLYVNEEYGFSIKYPDYLKPLAKKIDLSPEKQKYVEMCNSDELDGCGGEPWPNYLIAFQTESQSLAFLISIFNFPMNFKIGGIENEGITFMIQEPYNYYKYRGGEMKIDSISDSDIEKITDTITFFKPNKSLACLRTGPEGFDPINDKEYINGNSDKLIKFTSFYFDQIYQKCKVKEYYIWKDSTGKSPFESLSSCDPACK